MFLLWFYIHFRHPSAGPCTRDPRFRQKVCKIFKYYTVLNEAFSSQIYVFNCKQEIRLFFKVFSRKTTLIILNLSRSIMGVYFYVVFGEVASVDAGSFFTVIKIYSNKDFFSHQNAVGLFLVKFNFYAFFCDRHI